ncbi:MAG: hypothetical protein LIO65_06830, partial [Odoribacter sp.]|nr:hypothetical protein [Odoribacter sp.]
MSSNNIDSLFKKGLQKQSCEPPAFMWDKINGQLKLRKRRKRTLYTISSVAATIALFLGITLLINNKDLQSDVSLLYGEIEIIKDTASPVLSSVDLSKDFLITSTKTTTLSSPVTIISEHINIKEQINAIEIIKQSGKNNLENKALNLELKKAKDNKNFIPLVDESSYRLNEIYQKFLNSQRKTEKQKTRTEKEKSETPLKVMLSGHVNPTYSSGKNSTSSDVKSYNYGKEQINGVAGVGGGMKIAVQTNNKLTFQSGIMYTRLGQRTDENNIYMSSASTSSADKDVKNNVASPLGNIKSNSSAIIYRTEDGIALNNTDISRGNIEQLFDAVEVPLLVKYRLNENKLGINLAGGISSSFIVGNRAYLNYGSSRDYMGNT